MVTIRIKLGERNPYLLVLLWFSSDPSIDAYLLLSLY